MNKFFQLVESVLLEASYETSSIFKIQYSVGGLPDMSGPPEDNPWGAEKAWDTKLRYRKSAFHVYAVHLQAPRGEKYKNEGDQDVIFVKAPTTMKGEDFNRKLDTFLEQINKKCDFVERVSPTLIDFLNKREMKLKEWWALCGYNPEEKAKAKNPAKKALTREEKMAEIKAKAKALAMELRDTLISNGVSRENAVTAAKDAYHRFIQDFYNKSDLKLGNKVYSGPARTMDHPLMPKRNLSAGNKDARDNEAKRKAGQLYKELISIGISDEEARRRAKGLFDRLTSPPPTDD